MSQKRPPTMRRVGSSGAGPGHEPSEHDDATQRHTGGDVRSTPSAGPCALLDAAGVAEVLGVGRSTVYALDAREELPVPIVLGTRRRRWVTAEIEAWLLYGAPRRSAWARLWPRVRNEVLRR